MNDPARTPEPVPSEPVPSEPSQSRQGEPGTRVSLDDLANALLLATKPPGSPDAQYSGSPVSLRGVIAAARSEVALIEALGGCTCGPARLAEYESARAAHEPGCPMA